MSTYTIALKEIVDLYALDGASNLRDKIELARTKIFDFDYPFYDEAKRKDFETDFIRNFFMREIGFETEELWKFHLENYMRINMGYWNNLFKSELIEFDPLSNTKTDSTHNKTNDQTLTSTSETNGTATGSSTMDANGTKNTTNNDTITEDNFHRNLESDTPDGRLSITTNDGQGVIEYASKIVEDNENSTKTNSLTSDTTNTDHGTSSSNETSDVTNTGSATSNETGTETNHQEGKIGSQSYSKMIQEYRETFLRIEKQIFNEMNQLFMLVY